MGDNYGIPLGMRVMSTSGTCTLLNDNMLLVFLPVDLKQKRIVAYMESMGDNSNKLTGAFEKNALYTYPSL